jgi:hypothetical protein
VSIQVLALISCTKKKADRRCSARELYSASSFFRKALNVAEAVSDKVYVLSAKHGLVELSDRLSPYEMTLVGAPRKIQKEWSEKVYESLKRTRPYREAGTILWFSGMDYRRYLAENIREDGKLSVIPLEGLTQGLQGARLKELQGMPESRLKAELFRSRGELV